MQTGTQDAIAVMTASVSDLSCGPCRRRKAKCDRTLPSCRLCLKATEPCIYPLKRGRPGPKTGSTQKRPRRARKTRTPDPRAPSRVEGQAGSSTEAPSDRRSVGVESSVFSDAQTAGTDLSSQSFRPEPSTATTFSTYADTSNASKRAAATQPVHEGARRVSPTGGGDAPVFWDPLVPDPFNGPTTHSDAMLHTYHSLNISPNTLQQLLDSYFANMTTFSLFHQPTFNEKIRTIGPSLLLNALLASMFSFSGRFEMQDTSSTQMDPANELPSDIPCGDHFHQLALRFEEEMLTILSDETPPLAFLQAVVLTTFFQLTKGVHGRAWRWLGTCIRVAYELNLHLIDSNSPEEHVPSTAEELRAWTVAEEGRRCWWAIWEMDAFASTIRRVPTGISWPRNQTYLPVEDRLWFESKYHASCRLPVKPSDRWKRLQERGNESHAAWYIVVTSLMQEAQVLANMEGCLERVHPSTSPFARRGSHESSVADDLKVIAHALQCTLLALPQVLQYHNEPLSFVSLDSSEIGGTRRLHSAKYSIYLMAQMTRFMICHHYTFGGPSCASDRIAGPPEDHPGLGLLCTTRPPNANGLEHYAEAVDNIVLLLHRSSAVHIRYVNPFLATIIWLAAAVQLMHKKFGPSTANRDLVDVKLDVLRLTYKQFVKFWSAPIGLLHALDSLETHFDRLIDPESVSRLPVQHRRRASALDSLDASLPDASTSHGPGYKSSRTQPNLTGSGVNPMMVSDKGGSRPMDGNESSNNALGDHANPHLPTNHPMRIPPSADPMLDDMNFAAVDFDFGDDSDLPLCLDGLLFGSYAEGTGPVG
ncbi:hypothetical protein BU16DRAFT_502840 [Lophium mytilinum]|uniref:Zn(2)-C6 fungal-type domain-containing protein n=1 Tax=Lophium mytilinum TaxID=390894 RepID=A0A6A6R8Q6_9PEZI|nr:hypothetical protein BU16DRAFT_502840 [Lophium mytilinum]